MGQGESDNIIGDRLLLVDGHAYAYRAFHAIRRLTSPDGKPTNAIFGFIRMLGKMIETLKPSHVAVVWDGGLAAERVSQHPSYKAQRPPMPSDLDSQMTGIVDYLDAARIPSLCRQGVEADDWIAALATRSAQSGCNVVIASSDKDFMQLVGPRVGLLNPNDKKECIWTDAEVRTRTGVSPGQIVDWLSLIGDSVDNIPGVQGVGPKTATELLQQFGTIDSLYARIEQVESPRLRAKLAESQDVVRRNQELIRLRTDLAGDFELESFRAAQPDVPRLLGLFSGWGFRTLREELEKAQTVQHELF
jgi:DNA polymerase-1